MQQTEFAGPDYVEIKANVEETDEELQKEEEDEGDVEDSTEDLEDNKDAVESESTLEEFYTHYIGKCVRSSNGG